jgi:hypothetical protein
MNPNVLRTATAIGVAVAGIALVLLVRGMLTPMPPTGPLAIVESQPGSPQARNEGVLEITDECVRLVHPDGTSMLVIWVRGSVTWNATDRSIAVSTPDGRDLTLRNGDAVVLWGGGGPADTLERAGSWVRRPGEACKPPNWFLAVDVGVADEED